MFKNWLKLVEINDNLVAACYYFYKLHFYVVFGQPMELDVDIVLLVLNIIDIFLHSTGVYLLLCYFKHKDASVQVSKRLIWFNLIL